MKLASIEKITNVQPIPGADAIETATVLGWEVVIKKGEYQVGDMATYIQIDTIVPATEQYAFLHSRKYRVRTIKLRQQISQGLLVPLPEGNWAMGDDVTTLLGIKKYSKELPDLLAKPKMPTVWYKRWLWKLKYEWLVKVFPNLQEVNRRGFPTSLVPVTDEERIQNMPQVLEEYKGKQFVVSEKLDGSSITIIHELGYFKQSKYRVCSRRFELFNKHNDWYQVFVSTHFAKHIQKLVTHFGTANIIIQGEYIGKPQGNKYRLTANEIRLFNIFVNGKRLNQQTFYEVINKLNIPACPYIETVLLDYTLPQILAKAEGLSQLHTIEREGLVWRCVEHPSVSFKTISNKYLLLNEE